MLCYKREQRNVRNLEIKVVVVVVVKLYLNTENHQLIK